MSPVNEKELQESAARLSLNEYPYLDCPGYSVSIGKRELMDLRAVAMAYISETVTLEKEQTAIGWQAQEDEGWFY